MAVLDSASRLDCRRAWTQMLMAEAETIGLSKAELQAAIDATDDWIDANAAAYNSALPQPARGALTARQKARLLLEVIKVRYKLNA